MAVGQSDSSGLTSQVAVSAVVDSSKQSELLTAQPSATAVSNSVKILDPSEAPSEVWAKRLENMQDWELELFESHAKKDLNEYTSKAKESCSQFQYERWFPKIVQFIKIFYEITNSFTSDTLSSLQVFPFRTSLILGGVMCILQISDNYGQYQERIAQMLSIMGDRASILVQHDRETYKTDKQVQDALFEVYGDVLDFTHSALSLLYDKNKEKIRSSLNEWGLSLWKPFELKLGSIVKRFESHLDIFEEKAVAYDRKMQQIMHSFHVQDRITQKRDSAATVSAAQAADQEVQEPNLTLHRRFEQQQETDEQNQIREEIEQSRFERKALEKKKEKVISSLPSTQWFLDHDEVSTKHLPGTGKWLREDPTYQSWKLSESSDLLWINGKAGSGKSVLAALTISDVKLKEDSSVGVAYVYCRAVRSTVNSYIVILSTLLKQLCLAASNIDDIYDDVPEKVDPGQILGRVQIETKLISILSQFSETFLVVDGLDECQEPDEVALFLSRMIQRSTSPVKIAVFSRLNNAITMALTNHKSLGVDSGANEDDIKSYITDITAGQALKTLDSGPYDLATVYELCLERIWNQGSEKLPFKRDAAYKILIWTMNAKRTLSLEEMIEAIAIDTEKRTLGEGDKIDSMDEIIKICAGLILVNNERQLELIHSSLKSYLLSSPASPSQAFKAFRSLQNAAQHVMAVTCLTYLLLDRFDNISASTVEELEILQGRNPFLRYAGAHWASHIQDQNTEIIRDLTKELLYSRKHIGLFMQLFQQHDTLESGPFKVDGNAEYDRRSESNDELGQVNREVIFSEDSVKSTIPSSLTETKMETKPISTADSSVRSDSDHHSWRNANQSQQHLLDDTISIVSDRDEISSNESIPRSTMEQDSRAYFGILLAQHGELKPLFEDAFSKMSRAKFIRNIRRLLKRFYLDLLPITNSNEKKAINFLLKSRSWRAKLAGRIHDKARPESEEVRLELNGKEKITNSQLPNIEAWPDYKLAFLPLPDKRRDVNEAKNEDGGDDGSNDESDDDGSDESDDDGNDDGDYDRDLKYEGRDEIMPNIAKLQTFLFEGAAFKELIINFQTFLLPSKLGSLTRAILATPSKHVWISGDEDTSFSNYLKSLLEDWTGESWNWWPLKPRMRALPRDHCRIQWYCHCGTHLWTELPNAHAEAYRLLLRYRGSSPRGNHLCWRNSSKYSSKFWIKSVPESAAAATVSSQDSISTGSFLEETSRYNPNSSTQTSSPTRNKSHGTKPIVQQEYYVNIGAEILNQSFIFFGVKWNGPFVDLAHIDAKEHCDDEKFFSELRICYRELRRFWKYYFSLWQFGGCDFVKFEKTREEQVLYRRNELPVGPEEIQYEYKPRPPNVIPPLVPHEFALAFWLCQWWCKLLPWHRCIAPPSGTFALTRIPKRMRPLDLKTSEPEFFWGILTRLEPSFFRLFLYHLVIFAGPMAFWIVWQRLNPSDLQNASVPVLTVATLLSLFWGTIAVFKIFAEPEGATYSH